jgi:hypothetical protein
MSFTNLDKLKGYIIRIIYATLYAALYATRIDRWQNRKNILWGGTGYFSFQELLKSATKFIYLLDSVDYYLLSDKRF